MEFEKHILCIGTGHVGGPTMAIITHKCSQDKITVVDINPERIVEWNFYDLPIYEPRLDENVKKTRGNNLFSAPTSQKASGRTTSSLSALIHRQRSAV